MNILYWGKYRKRFSPVIEQIKALPLNSKVLELCFGDTYLADFCKKAGCQWTGIDLNQHFVERARKKGLHAVYDDLAKVERLPESNICIIVGSLYHFHKQTYSLLEKVFKAADVLVISEPVFNISSSKGLLGYIAKRASDAGKGHEIFRYDATSLKAELENYSKPLNYKVAFVESHGKDLIIKLIKNGNC